MENGGTPVEFDIFGKKLTVSSGRMEYNRLRSRFRALAREQADEAKVSIEQFADNPKWLLCDGFRWAKPYFAKAADLAVEELLQKGVFDLDGEVYLKEHFDLAPWERGFKAASNAYKRVVDAEKQREKERAEQTDELGSSWGGGGFGLKGAIKGAVEAEALNLASAALSGAFNAIGRKMSKKENEKKFQNIFERRKDEIVNGVFEAIANGADALVACCNKHGIKIEGAVTAEEAVKAERMCNNLKAGKIPPNMVADVKLGILDANPYCQEFYGYVYMTNGDPSGELEKVGKFFGISFDGFKHDAFIARLGKCDCKSEDALDAYRAKAVALAAELKYDATETLKRIDEELRTVDGRLCATREEAQKQRILSVFEKELDISTEVAAIASLAALDAKIGELAIDGEWKRERVRSAIARFDQMACMAFGRQYQTREEARIAKGEVSRFLEGVELAAKESSSRIYTSTNIPAMLVKGAVANLGVVPGERIVSMVVVPSFSSLFKGLNTGLVLTEFGIRWRNAAVSTTRNFISWQGYAMMNPPVINGKLSDFGNGAVFEAGGFLAVPVESVLTMLQRVHELCKEAICFTT